MKSRKMKFNPAIVAATLFAALLISCSPKAVTPAPQDTVKARMIANNWTMQSVNVDGVDQTSVFKNLTIQFTDGNFTTTNGGVVWPASGTWSFTSADATAFKRNDGLEVKVDVTDATLKLTLTWATSTLSGGKAGSIKGQNVFNFVK